MPSPTMRAVSAGGSGVLSLLGGGAARAVGLVPVGELMEVGGLLLLANLAHDDP